MWWRRRLQEEAGFISGYPSVAVAVAFVRRRTPYLPAGSTTRPAAQIIAIHFPVASLCVIPQVTSFDWRTKLFRIGGSFLARSVLLPWCSVLQQAAWLEQR